MITKKRNYNRNLTASSNPTEQAAKGLRSEVNKAGIPQKVRDNDRHKKETTKRFEEKKNTLRKRKAANRKARSKN